MATSTSTPAARLPIGDSLDDTWEILERISPKPGATGGNFSVGYLVRDTRGRKGFLKALDFEPAIRTVGGDPTRILQALTEAFNFERDLVRLSQGMDRVVSGFADGTTYIDGTAVPYIVFEQANTDLRSTITHAATFELAVAMRLMHHVSVGMWQLHSKDVAHQDLKPSNVMLFEDNSKVGDLGRASRYGRTAVHDDLSVAGDPAYAPPELLYGHVDPDWSKRRLGADVYLLGSLLGYLILGHGTTPLLVAELDPAHRPMAWHGTFKDVLPYLQNAFQRVVRNLERSLTVSCAGEILKAFKELCEPDPELRGHSTNRRTGTPYSLERYHPLFDRLAIKLRIEARRNLS